MYPLDCAKGPSQACSESAQSLDPCGKRPHVASTQGQFSSFLDGEFEGFMSSRRASERTQVAFGAFRRAETPTQLRSSKTPFVNGYVEAIVHEVAVVRVQPVANVKVRVEAS